MPNILQRLRNALSSSVAIAPITAQAGKAPPVSFKTLSDVYTKDPHVFGVINSQVLLIIGPLFHVTGDNSGAVELCEKFNEKINIREVIHTIATELMWGGNSFWLLSKSDDELKLSLQHIPLTYVQRIKTDNYGKPVELIIQHEAGRLALPWDSIVHFYIWKHDNEVFGMSILRPFVEVRTDHKGKQVTPPIYFKWKMERNLERIWDRYAQRFIYVAKELTGDKFEEFKATLANIEAGDDIALNTDLDIKPVSTEIKTRFPEILQYFQDMILYNFLNITPRLFTQPGFTYASAQVAKDIQDMMITTVQRRIKEILEKEIYGPLLKLHGFGDANISFNWGLPQRPKLEIQHIFQAAYPANALATPIITREEARKMLLDLGWPLEERPQEKLGERFDYPKWVETLDEIILYFVEPSKVDLATIRYQSIDSDRGITLAVADVAGDVHGMMRRPVALIFVRANGWSLDKAKRYYEEAFPRVFEAFLRTLS